MSSIKTSPNVPYEEPQWSSSPAWKLPGWAEPLMVASILIISMIFTRRKNFSIFGNQSFKNYPRDKDNNDLLASECMLVNDFPENCSADNLYQNNQRKKGYLCGFITIENKNSGRFSQNLHSRILRKFPFLLEMFYWIITYAFYRCTAILSQAIFSKTGIWDVARDHALSILEFEHFSLLSFLWPVHERDVQQWFMRNHQTFLTVLNRSYALIHIPGTVGFIAWYYYAAPSHAVFATVRRTMTLTNLLAFSIFIMYPCMPPRLLPREYGFLDSVGRNNSESIWMSGKYVNSLAAMPSMHFGYAFCIGSTMMYHSGIFQALLKLGEQRSLKVTWTIFYILFAIWYPSWIFITIIATANHYYLDVCVAIAVVIIAFFCNRVLIVLLPLENHLLRILRLEKPRPTTGIQLMDDRLPYHFHAGS
ncbi:putative integral membrane protein [Golovinomyces cichoracearum]|uniref:Putative integral membrane protein n=1 Tax=Golovinomyces cichoracearum TaxID=62708 RepID=A0A420IVL8_9PEZI|nr:putative integral membrane protein [Golovinomyces cichoracearum]